MAVKTAEDFENISEHLHAVQTDFRLGKLDGSFTDAEDAEAVVEEYFRRLDYDTFKLRGLNYQKKAWLKKWFEIFEGFDFTASGIPDFFVCRLFFHVKPASPHGIHEEGRVQDYRFVEVKSENDDLRQSQLRWIGSNPHLPIEVIVVTG